MKDISYALLIAVAMSIAAFGGGYAVGKHSGSRDTTFTVTKPIPVKPDSGKSVSDSISDNWLPQLEKEYGAYISALEDGTKKLQASSVSLKDKNDSLSAKLSWAISEIRRLSPVASVFDSTYIVTEKGDTLTRGRISLAFTPTSREFYHSLLWNPIQFPPTSNITRDLYEPRWIKPTVAFTSAVTVVGFYEKKPLVGCVSLGVTLLLSLIKF